MVSKHQEQPKQDGEIILHSKLSYPAPPAAATIASELLGALKRHQGRKLLTDARSGQVWTGADLLGQCCRLAKAMRQTIGLAKNDCIMFMSDHVASETLLVLGAQLAGVAICGSSVQVYEELVPVASLCKPKAIACYSKTYQVAMKLRETIDQARGAKLIFAGHQDDELPTNWASVDKQDHFNINQMLISSDESLQTAAADLQLIEHIVDTEIKPTDFSVIMQTSGSTGPPKLVPQEHRFLINDMYSMLAASKQSPLGAANKPLYPLTKDDVLAGDLPLDQGAGIMTMFTSIVEGSNIVIMEFFNAQLFWENVAKFKITASVASAGFAYRLFAYLKALIAKGAEARRGLDLSSFRYISCVGSKMSFVDLIREVNQVYTNINVCQFYGATEIGYICMLPIEDNKQHLNSVGYLVPDVRAKVVDLNDSNKTLGPNQQGELLVQSASLFSEYVILNNQELPEVMERAFTGQNEDRFYRTGDLVSYDSEGRFFVYGRIKETLSLFDDWKVMPAEIEQVINKHPLVELSSVIGVPHPEQPNADTPKAFVKLIQIGSPQFKQLESSSSASEADKLLAQKLAANDHDFITKDIYEFQKSQSAEMKWLLGGVRVLDEFPKVGYFGKIDKKALKLLP